MLHGREAEQSRLAAVLESAAAGRSACLVLSGEPGVGKSALLEDLLSHVHGMQVLRAQGLESESPLAFAGLHQLLRPVLGLLDRLPAPQSRALRVAFGQEMGDPVQPFLVGLATLGMLTEAAETSPVLCLVDDAHWLDAATADALVFAARRLQADPVALVFTARVGDTRVFAPRDIPTLTLTGLDHASARSLLRERSGVLLPDRVADAVLRQTNGNPLALVELPATLTSDQLEGSMPLPVHLHLTDAVQRVFLDRCRRLPEAGSDAAAGRRGGRHRQPRGRAGGRRPARCQIQRGSTPPNGRTCWSPTATPWACATHWCARRSTRPPPGTSAGPPTGRSPQALGDSGDPDRQAWHWAASVDGPDPAVVSALARRRRPRRASWGLRRRVRGVRASRRADRGPAGQSRTDLRRGPERVGRGCGSTGALDARPGTRGHR